MTRTLLSATDAEQLDRLVDLVHDDWFRTTDVLIVNGVARVDIPLYAGAGRSRIPSGRQLVVNGVLDVELFDDARIGLVDINEIAYDDGKVSLESGFPVRVEFRVASLNVSVLSDDAP